MESEGSIAWVAKATAVKMLDISREWSTKRFNARNIRTRLVKTDFLRIECCLEDVEAALKNGRMRRIESKERKEDLRRSAPIGTAPSDPISTKEAALILDVGLTAVKQAINLGRITLYRKSANRGFSLSREEVCAHKREIDRWKENYILRQDERAAEIDENWTKSEVKARSKTRQKRVGPGGLNEDERDLHYLLTTHQAAFVLNVTSVKVRLLRRQGLLKAYPDPLFKGKGCRYMFLKSDVAALRESEAHCEKRGEWEQTHQFRDWRAEARLKLQGEKPKPFVPRSAEAPTVHRRAPFERPEWMHSQCRDWTAYTYEAEARVRRTMKPQW